MPIRASSLVLRTSRTFNVVAPSGRTVCQSLPPSKTSPESLSPSNEPPGTTPIRRYPPGVAPTICSFLTVKRITNNGWVLSVLRASGRLSLRSVNMMLGWGLGMSFSLKLLRSKSGLAAIDSDDLTGEVVHLVRGEKHDRLSDLLSLSSAFHRHAGDQASISVSTGPGATALTRTPAPAPSSAAAFVRPSTACLLATYIDAPAAPRLPNVDGRFKMLPCRWASISCLRLRIVPSTLVSKVAA